MVRQVTIWVLLFFQAGLALLAAFYIIRLLLVLINFKKATLPYVPSSGRVKRMMIMSGLLTDADVIVDLGSGTGELLSIAKRRFPTAQLRGVEKRHALVWLGKLRFAFADEPKPELSAGDMFEHPIDDADAIIGFWITDLMPELLEKFENEAKEGAIIMSNMFSLPDSQVIEHLDTIEDGGARVHVYRKTLSTP
jgi:hypothetical protein